MRRMFMMNRYGVLMRQFDVRQGLPMRITGQANRIVYGNQMLNYMTQGYKRGMALAPDHKHVVLYGWQQGYTAHDDIEAGTYYNGSIPFSTYVTKAIATNDAYYLFGTSPLFYCYRWSDRSVDVFDVGGLGDVVSACLSPDGSKVFLHHNAAPNVRAYDLASKEFVDAPATVGAGVTYNYNQSSEICCTSNGAFVAVCSSSSPNLSILDAETLGVLSAKSNNNYTIYYWSEIMPHPHDENSVIVARNAGGTLMLNINCSTGEVEQINAWPALNAAFSSAPNWFTTGMTYSKAADEIFVALTSSTAYAIAVLDGRTLAFKRQEWIEDEGLPLANHLNTDNSFNNCVKLRLVEDDCHQITGTVRDINNAPCARTVRAFRRSDGVCMAQTESDATTGDYRLLLPDAEPYDVQFQALDGENLNDLFFARSEPEPITV